MRWVKQIWQDKRGNFALTTALMTIPVLIGVGVAVDLANLQSAKSNLRDAAETAAVASAKSFNTNDEDRRDRAHLMMEENFDIAYYQADTVKMDVELTPRRSTVAARTVMPTKLMSIIGQKELSLSVEVAAETVIEPACVLINSPNRSSAIKLQGHPSLNTVDCYVHANSNSLSSANAQGNPQLKESEVCLNGGFSGKKWIPGPMTDCGTRQDPYFDIEPPDVPPCDFNKFKIGKTAVTLSPGHYCGGLKLPSNSQVHLKPGIYFISKGGLDLGANANLVGDGVMFYLEGDDANFEFHSGGNIDLMPPNSGEYRGILLFQDRDAMPKKPNAITGGGTLSLKGIIYTIKSHLEFHGSPEVFIEGAGTMILTNTMTMQGSPELTLVSVDNKDLLPNDRIIGRDAYIRVIH